VSSARHSALNLQHREVVIRGGRRLYESEIEALARLGYTNHAALALLEIGNNMLVGNNDVWREKVEARTSAGSVLNAECCICDVLVNRHLAQPNVAIERCRQASGAPLATRPSRIAC